MQDKTERWVHLCELASVEQDPSKLLALIEEINELLAAKEARLQRFRAQPDKEKPHSEE